MAKDYILDRLREPSTLRGLATLIALVTGVTVEPENLSAVFAGVIALSEILRVVLPDSWGRPE